MAKELGDLVLVLCAVVYRLTWLAVRELSRVALTLWVLHRFFGY